MNLLLLGWGVVFGVLASAPTGPVAVLILRNTLTRGTRAGLVTVASLLAAELLYLALFVLGIGGAIMNTPWLRDSLFLAGAVTLVAVGVQSLRAKRPADPAPDAPRAGDVSLFRTGFLLTVTNPAILMIFAGFLAAARAAFGAETVRRHLLAALLSMELGTALWFGAVVLGLSRLPERVAAPFRRYSDRVAGVALIVFGLWLFLNTLRQRAGG